MKSRPGRGGLLDDMTTGLQQMDRLTHLIRRPPSQVLTSVQVGDVRAAPLLQCQCLLPGSCPRRDGALGMLSGSTAHHWAQIRTRDRPEGPRLPPNLA